MRDIGALLWVVLVAIGVISSVVSNARRQAARTPVAPRQFPQAPPRQFPQAPPRQFPPTTPRQSRPPAVDVDADAGAAPPQPPAATPAPLPHPAERTHARRRRFAGRAALARAVIAAEVLGKPRALRDE